MKKITFICLSVVFLLPGCQKQQQCVSYAPADASFNFVKYNNVSELYYFFSSHDKEIERHIGDTIKLYGWSFMGDDRMSMPDNETFNSNGSLYIVDSDNHTTNGGATPVLCVPLRKMSPSNDSVWVMPESWIDKKLYIKGTLGTLPADMDGCSIYEIILTAFCIDTIMI